jgi:hypothetical protein
MPGPAKKLTIKILQAPTNEVYGDPAVITKKESGNSFLPFSLPAFSGLSRLPLLPLRLN